MIKMTCMVVDDEALAREGIERYIAEVPFLELVGSYGNPVAAQEALQQQPVDLLFLDINMPLITGLNLLELLPNPPITILATAYPNFALEGYRLNALDYLLKPISLERFLKAVNKAREQFLLKQSQVQAVPPQPASYMFVKHGKALEKVQLADLLYVEAMQNYMLLHTSTRKLLVHMTFKALEQRLPAEQFIRIHKSYLVNLDHATSLNGYTLYVGNTALPVGRAQRPLLLQRLGHHLL